MAEIILTIVVEAVKCLAPPAYRQISYLRESKYTSNLQNLKTEVENLKSERVTIEHRVGEAERKGEEIEENVKNWLAGANNVIVAADKFTDDEATASKRCFKGLCPNLETRRRLSKEAERQKEAVVKVLEARRFDRISYCTAPEDIRLIYDKNYEPFESRMFTLRNILDAIEDPDVDTLGIYGMGGIGKTMLAEEVARKVQSDKLVDRVVFVEVSQDQDIRKIQGEIADQLGLKFHEESESGRANRLFKRIKVEKKILIILDNIWENLDLRVVGIPHGDGHKGCKVLLTARSLDVLSGKMDSRPNFSVGVLKEEEAWSLFKKMAGDYAEGSELKWIARDVVRECAGLPVSIVTAARALRNDRSLFDWKDALEQLRRPSSTNFMHVQPTAYNAIKLSYDKLEGEELKSIFLLIGYTAIASIDGLLMYGMGLGLFQGVNKIEVARARVHTLVHKLKASSMLLDHISKEKELFSMHDVVRDVAISIASTEGNVFTATNEQVDGCREWLDESAITLYTSIILHDIKTNVLPEVVQCPQLKLLFIRADKESSSLRIPNKFFERMIQVRVLNLTYMNLLSLPSTLGFLINLRTLSLYYCKLLDISVIGDLKKLEILCLRGCDIKQLPIELGQLTWLKLLDLRDCSKLEVIPPNVISNLSLLEELYIGGRSFRKWGEVKGVKNASLEELKHLPNLTSFELDIHDVNTLPRGLFMEKLERYRIRIGDLYWESTNIWGRELRLRLNNKACLKDWLIVQLQGIEHLELFELQEQDVNYFANELVRVGSSQLKFLRIHGSKRQKESAHDMQSNEISLEDYVNISNTLFIEKAALPNLENLKLHSINVERIWQSHVAVMSCGIHNLTHLTLYNCMNLRCLFSSSTVSNNSFVQLQHIEIEKCHVLEELIVVDNLEERRNNVVMFPQLQYLKMYDLEKLTSFCTEDVDILEFPSLKQLWISGCPKFMVRFQRTTNNLTKKVFPNLEELIVDAKHIVTNVCLFSEDLLCKLKCLDVEFDDEWTTILSLDNFLQRFHTMKVLKILGAYYFGQSKEKVENGMEVIIRKANICCGLKHILKQESSSIMNNLVILHVIHCDHLINLVPSATSFQNLTTLEVAYCYRLKYVLTSSTAKSLARLKEMKIESCEGITEIVVAEDEVIAFRQLKELKLLDLKSLTSFCFRNCAFKFPSLERLVVNYCPNMRIFSGAELSTPKLHKVQLSRWDDDEHWTWERDLNTTIQQLNLKKESLLKKPREGLQSQQFSPPVPAPAPNLNLQNKSESLLSLVAGVWSDDDSLQLEATTQFRKMLSIDRSQPIEEVIQAGVVPRFVEFLIREDFPQLQYEAAWVLINITSGASENTKVVIDHGAVPMFVKLLASPIADVREQAVCALGNIAGDSPRCRDLVLSEEALIPLLAQLNKHAKLSMLRTATHTLYTFCMGNPEPPFDQVRPALPVVAQLVRSNDEEVLSHACWTLSYLSDGTNVKIQAVIEVGVCSRLVKLLGHPSPSVLTPALRTVGNIVRGDDFQTQCIINCGALPYLLGLLTHNHEENIKKEACWTISNITAGNREQIQAVIDAGLIVPLFNLLQDAEFDVKKEAAWAISNATKGGTHEQIKYLVREGCIKPLCDLLCANPKIVTVGLKGLENILKVGEAEKNMDTDIGHVNQYAQLVEEAEGLEKIENLQNHDNNEIHETSVKILETYWCGCGRVVGPQPGLPHAGNEEEDAPGSNVITNG